MGLRVPVHVFSTDSISRAGLESQLRFQPDIHVVGAEQLGGEVVAVVAAESPDPATLDAVADLRRRGVDKLVLVVAALNDADLIAVIEAGVSALIRRPEVSPERLSDLVRRAAAGEAELPADLLTRLFRQVSHMQNDVLTPRGLRLAGLSPRETAILKLVAEGYDTDEIAARLSYSPRTVKNVLHGVTTRFQLRNRSHAVAYALKEGLI
ncbi:DNA-binding NarL/FixJ family response regulator [Kribbella amoyensis]|uniref:DNA-binding NarL/FixJ family response regulator n=1 Tax=Kribbella amoyensis TaxID=996641 RepID=A0A561BKJ3_9ACTN|nr:response regulator transcription factor [Kribbella amoyensis]TWD79381.1 DNA-binding NarL/FixJ family response regulator [Kribbella amoyensis]